MKKYEIPLLILVSTLLMSYGIGLSLFQGAIVTVFVCVVYWSGRRIK